MEAYYFQSLTNRSKAAYHAMQEGLSALRGLSFPCPVWKIGSCPIFFSGCGWTARRSFTPPAFSYRFAPGAERAELLPDYL